VRHEKQELAVTLRRKMTGSESALWQCLRAGRTGYHFRRQQVIDGFIVDFYCSAAGLVIEVDGPVHENSVQADAERSQIIAARGLEVIRVTNDEVQQDPAQVALRIAARCFERTLTEDAATERRSQ
jgi:very-short-patch-repair endonuclease